MFLAVKEPLLLIHGFTDTAATWRPVAPLLEPHHELIVPTVCGHCGGPALPDPLPDPLAAIADGLEQVLDAAGHDKVHIAGNSLGGWLAFEMANRGRALSVVAISPAFGWEGERPPARTERQFRMAHRLGPWSKKRAEFLARRPGLRKLAFRELMAHPERVPPRTAYDLIVGSAACAIFDPLMEQIEANQYRGKWGDLGVPTRIAWGTKDRTIPAKTCSAWYRDALPDAEWVELPDCGHLAQHDDPELVARTILEVTARAPVTQVL
jgi:pimeloyl-ACP methyl ester carboxylesterase